MNVKKTLVSLLFIFSFLLFTPAVFAQGVTVTDDAGLFTAEEIAELTDLATDINQTIKGEVFIVTTTDNTQDPETFADDFLREQIGNDNNGSVLLLDMGQREIYISTSGNMIDYLTDSRIEQILDSVYEGMSEADLKKIFDRFYRVDASRRHSGDGAGLGLAITRSILRSHGGDIEGRTGKGCNIFEMWIPTSIVTPRSAD